MLEFKGRDVLEKGKKEKKEKEKEKEKKPFPALCSSVTFMRDGFRYTFTKIAEAVLLYI